MIFYTLINFWKKFTFLVVYLLWRQPQPEVCTEVLEGKIDAVIEVGKVWRVRHLATYWSARSHKKINLVVGECIRVVGRKGLVLLIEPMEEEKPENLITVRGK